MRSSSPIRSAKDVAVILVPLIADLDREAFWILLLDGRHRPLGLHHVSTGSLTATLVHPREVFKAAILANAAAIILAHNHPSGDPHPSRDDRILTRRLWEAGKLIGIEVLDHVILGARGTFASMSPKPRQGIATPRP